MPSRRAKTRPDAGSEASEEAATQRLDRWLWFARITKSRSLAASLIVGGKVRVNKVRVTKPAHSIKTDDVVTVAVHRNVRVVRMRAPGTRRGPAAEAQLLFDDLTPAADTLAGGSQTGVDVEISTPSVEQNVDAPHRAPGSGRPTKRERRSLDRLRRDNDGV